MYTEHFSTGRVVPVGTGVLGVEALTAAAVHGEYAVLGRCKVRRIMFMVTTAPDAAVTLEFNRRPTLGSASGEIALGTLVIPSGTAAGTVVFKDIDPETLEVGDALALEVANANSASAGAGYYGFELYMDPEYSGNEANMLASA